MNRIINIIKTLWNRLFNKEQSFNHNIRKNPDKYVRLFEVRNGQSFKGHQGGVYINTVDGNTDIEIYNKYFSGYINCVYKEINNTTNMHVQHVYGKPNWMMDKTLKLQKILNVIEPIYLYYHSRSNSNTIVKVNINCKYDITIFTDEIYEGVNIPGHKENIERLKELSMLGSKVRKWFKKVDINDIKIKLEKYSVKDNPTYCVISDISV